MTKSSNNDPIANALGISPVTTTSSIVQSIIADAHDDSAKADFQTARSNVLNVISTMSDSVDKLAEIASQSQHPRAFEVLAKMVDTMLVANKQLLEMQLKIREISTADVPTNENARTVHNNNLFVGSTAELQKVLESMKNGTANN